jgi:fatty-acyl-CoA synthase
MFISGGENIYPAEIENVLARHPDILEAAVIGFTDARWGEVGCAFVVARDGRMIDPSALTAFCRVHLAAYKVPRRFVTLPELPRTAAGKVPKHTLAALLSEARDPSAARA